MSTSTKTECKPLSRVVMSLTELLMVTWVSGLLAVVLAASGVGGLGCVLTMSAVALFAWLLAPSSPPAPETVE